MKAAILWLCAAVVVASLATASFAQTSYKFVNIADTTGPVAQFSYAVAINDSRQVAYWAFGDDGLQGIYLASSGGIKTIADPRGQFNLFSDPDINNAGVISFRGRLDDSTKGIFTSDGEQIRTIALARNFDPPLSDYFDLLPWTAINDAGDVAFFAEQRGGILETCLYVNSSDLTRTIASPEDALFPRPSNGVSINNAGAVAFVARPFNGREDGIFTHDGQSFTEISSLNILGAKPVINDRGIVAFTARGEAFISEGGVLSKVVGDGDVDVISDVSMNNVGGIAFVGYSPREARIRGIFTGADRITDKVIKTGEPIFGSSLERLDTEPVINNYGDIAFRYILANGVEGIALAIAMPEPRSAAFLAAALLGCVATRYACRTPRRTSG